MSLPPDLSIPFDFDGVVESFEKKDGVEFAKALKTIHDAIMQQYADIAAAINNGPDYVASTVEPIPDDGNLLVWKDTSTGTYYLLYNDTGTVKKCTFS